MGSKYTHFDKVICNSQYTQKLAEDIYHIKSSVIYPKIKDEYYFAGISPAPKPYFVCVGRLVNFVRECELIIQTFNALKLPLLMIGDGPDAQYLKSIAEDSIISPDGLIMETSSALSNTVHDSSISPKRASASEPQKVC